MWLLWYVSISCMTLRKQKRTDFAHFFSRLLLPDVFDSIVYRACRMTTLPERHERKHADISSTQKLGMKIIRNSFD